jgi:hypothetical protein
MRLQNALQRHQMVTQTSLNDVADLDHEDDIHRVYYPQSALAYNRGLRVANLASKKLEALVETVLYLPYLEALARNWRAGVCGIIPCHARSRCVDLCF